VVWLALLVAFASATQDIALDAFRIESADACQQGVLAATYQTGYRLAMIWAGAGVLWVAAWAEVPAAVTAVASTVSSTVPTPGALYQNAAWQAAYLVMAASMSLGVLTVLFSREPVRAELPPARNAAEWLRGALVDPFADFLRRYRWQAVLILLLIGTYRISDVVMGIMANPFYVDMGYTKDEVATVTKVYGVIMTLVGAFLGGALTVRWGVHRILFLGAALSALTNLLFAWLAGHGHDVTALIAIISADNLSGGIASAAFIAYLSGLTNVQYSATQYALFSSMMLLAPKWLAGFSGVAVDAVGYPAFFTGTAVLGLPVLILVAISMKKMPSIA
jgi:PAT family beta-lactamase induction signal transducer AmpG